MILNGYLSEEIEGIEIFKLCEDYTKLDFDILYILLRLNILGIAIPPDIIEFINDNFRREIRLKAITNDLSIEESLLEYFGVNLFVTKICQRLFNQINVTIQFTDYIIESNYSPRTQSIFNLLKDNVTTEIDFIMEAMCIRDQLLIHENAQARFILNSLDYLKEHIDGKDNDDIIEKVLDGQYRKAHITKTEKASGDLELCLQYIKTKMPPSYFNQEDMTEVDLILEYVRGQIEIRK